MSSHIDIVACSAAALNIADLLRDPFQPQLKKLRATSVRDSIFDQPCPSSLRKAEVITHVVCGHSLLEIKTRLSLHHSKLHDS